MNILAVDSSSKPASSAVVKDGRLISEIFVNNSMTHSRTLMSVIDKSLEFADITLSDIDLIACITGPGSFTGVRIGVACVKGLAFSNSIPCVGISALEAMAYNYSGVDAYVCSVMDARCSQVYTALFSCENGTVSRLSADEAISIAELCKRIDKLNKTVYLVGDGVELVFSQYQGSADVRLSSQLLRYQRSSSAAFAAMNMNPDEYTAPELLAPIYLRLPQAQRELKNKLKGE